VIIKFTIILLLVTSAIASCRKNEAVSANTGFYSFKEEYYLRNSTLFNHWTFDSVEVYEPITNTLAIRYIIDGSVLDSVKFINPFPLPTGIGTFFPHFIINPSTNIITNVHNIFPDDGRGRKAFLDTGFISRYDAVAKTYYLHYFMTQNGRPDLIFHDTLTFLP
jgi:hypothetical protein